MVCCSLKQTQLYRLQQDKFKGYSLCAGYLITGMKTGTSDDEIKCGIGPEFKSL